MTPSGDTMTEQPDPHALARLAVEAAPHVDLLKRIGGHLDLILRAAAVLAEDWTEIEAAMTAAQAAPETVRAAFMKSIWSTYAYKHGLPAEVMGALAFERRRDAAPQPAAPALQPPAPQDRPPAPGETQRRAIRVSMEEREERARMAEECAALIREIGLNSKELAAELHGLGLTFVHSETTSALSSGRYARALRNGDALTGGFRGLTRMPEILEALRLLAEARSFTPEPAQPAPEPQAAEAAPVKATPQVHRPAPPSTRREREARVMELLRNNEGQVHLKEVARACDMPIGATATLLGSMSDLRHVGAGRYRLT